MHRLTYNDNYKRPKQTYTDMLDDDDIADKLEDYIKVNDIYKVPLNTHIRYFILELDDNTKQMTRKFRLGGSLFKKDEDKEYIVLSSGRKTWSVQIANTVFYKKLSIKELKMEYDKEIDDLKKINKKLYKQNLKMIAKLKELGYEVKL